MPSTVRPDRPTAELDSVVHLSYSQVQPLSPHGVHPARGRARRIATGSASRRRRRLPFAPFFQCLPRARGQGRTGRGGVRDVPLGGLLEGERRD